MSSPLALKDVSPSILLRRGPSGLQQLIRVTVSSDEGVSSGTLTADVDGTQTEWPLDAVPSGESTHEVFIAEVPGPCEATFVLKAAGEPADQKHVTVSPPHHWTVHMIQRSHHDVGYTDLPSRTLVQHARYLDDAIDMADATSDLPAESQFRLVIEQAWSLMHFLRTASKPRLDRMIELLRSGRIEVTALFGNMTTELCGPEQLIRTLYPAFALKRQYGIPIVSAEHNDVPGISWGLCRVLTDAGIRTFCPGIPDYYAWSKQGMRNSWDTDTMLGSSLPGAFWWETPSGARLLVWINRSGAGGPCTGMSGLETHLSNLAAGGYAYRAVRWPVAGGAGDNSPYTDAYCHTAARWNEQWAFPRLLCSTDALFFADVAEGLPADVPVHRGELPGQDYPFGAMSTAAATTANRRTHVAFLSAERLATAASQVVDHPYPKDDLDEANEEMLWHDEHTWGLHFPCGPGADASAAEKAVHAYRAAALVHDVANKAMAHIADRVRLDPPVCPHLVVFNTLGQSRTGVVRAPLREIENVGRTRVRVETPVGPGEEPTSHLGCFSLGDRNHLDLPSEIIEGRFDLVDRSTNERVPFEIIEIEHPCEPLLHAPERYGAGSGGKRYGAQEQPDGLKRDLCFVADDVPACGYKAYALRPRGEAPSFAPQDDVLTATSNAIENAHYRIEVDTESGVIASIVDKALGRELLDRRAPHGFGALVVRDARDESESVLERMTLASCRSGPICATLSLCGQALGHPAVWQTITLYRNIKRIDLAVRVQKDPTPLLETCLAFPFAFSNPRFRYEGTLSMLDPVDDHWPGAFWDRLTVQNWVKVTDGDASLILSPLDAPIVRLGGFWPGYLSPAHACVSPDPTRPEPIRLDAVRSGQVYSTLFANNFGTNFAVSQTGSVVFRYVIQTFSGDVPDTVAAACGWDAATPMEQILTADERERTLPPAGGFVEIDNDAVTLLACKHAEDGRGLVLRLWNVSPREQETRVRLCGVGIEEARFTNVVEEDIDESLTCDGDRLVVRMPPQTVKTIRVIPGA